MDFSVVSSSGVLRAVLFDIRVHAAHAVRILDLARETGVADADGRRRAGMMATVLWPDIANKAIDTG